MKSFRFYLTDTPEPPPRRVEDYSPEELAGFVEDFRHRRLRLRWGKRVVLAIAACGTAVALGGFALALNVGINASVVAPYFVGILLLNVAMVAAALLKTARCPACRNELMLAGEYCPHCGAKSLAPAGWRTDPCCSECRREHGRQAAAVWDHRYCSVCGVRIADEHAGEPGADATNRVSAM